MPAPSEVRTPSVAAVRSAVVTCVTVAVGLSPLYIATAPATCGEAIEVPWIVRVEVFDVIQPAVISVPGALISTHGPKFVNEARPSPPFVAPTAMALGADAGDFVHASTRSLPAATTTAIPALLTLSIASLKVVDRFPPILKLSTA